MFPNNLAIVVVNVVLSSWIIDIIEVLKDRMVATEQSVDCA